MKKSIQLLLILAIVFFVTDRLICMCLKEIDKKISNILGDLKILMYTNRDPYRIDNKIDTLDKLIDERNTKI